MLSRRWAATKVNVFLDHAKIPYGRNWYDTIKESLQRANCFVLLVPDDTDEREWPIFEAGLLRRPDAAR